MAIISWQEFITGVQKHRLGSYTLQIFGSLGGITN
jgi:hypothetical protein